MCECANSSVRVCLCMLIAWCELQIQIILNYYYELHQSTLSIPHRLFIVPLFASSRSTARTQTTPPCSIHHSLPLRDNVVHFTTSSLPLQHTHADRVARGPFPPFLLHPPLHSWKPLSVICTSAPRVAACSYCSADILHRSDVFTLEALWSHRVMSIVSTGAQWYANRSPCKLADGRR